MQVDMVKDKDNIIIMCGYFLEAVVADRQSIPRHRNEVVPGNCKGHTTSTHKIRKSFKAHLPVIPCRSDLRPATSLKTIVRWI